MRAILVLTATLGLVLATHTPTPAQAASDSSGITQAALDYVEGWYQADADRMRRSVHPELVKRLPLLDSATGAVRLEELTAERLVASTGRGGGSNTPAERRVAKVEIKDIFGNIAMVRVEMADWVDYMQLTKVEGRWVIVNVLWQLKAASVEGGQ